MSTSDNPLPKSTGDSDEVHSELVKFIGNLQHDIKNIRRDLVRTLAVSVLTVLIVLGISIWYAGHVRSVGDQRWCTLMTNLDDRYQQALKTPPPDPKQAESLRETAAQFHQLREDLGC